MLVRSFVIMSLTAVAAACTGDPSDGPGARFVPPVEPTPDVYSGVFPCDNCPGISTTLWLHADGTFFWHQAYPDDAGDIAATARNLGRWHVDPEGILVLEGGGPARRFRLASPDELQMLSFSALEHRLARDAGAPPFTDSVRIEGMAFVEDGNATFTECNTGLVAPAGGAAFLPFLRQYRSLGFRGEPVFVELEARFEWSDDGSLQSFAVERFITLKPNGKCSRPLPL
jgi:copper homeostasis protein (lipoprotein)